MHKIICFSHRKQKYTAKSRGICTESPVELIQREDVATILDAFDRHDVAMTRRKHFTVNVAWQWSGASVLQPVVPQHAHQHFI